MRDLQKITEECIKKLKDIDIPIQDNKIVEISFKRIQGFGKCFLTTNGEYYIYIAQFYQNEEVDLDELYMTIIHELLHTCENCMDHTDMWMQYAQRVDETYAYNITFHKTSYDVKNKKKTILARMVCSNCICKWDVREKKSLNLIQAGKKCYCPWCGSEMKVDADWNFQ